MAQSFSFIKYYLNVLSTTVVHPIDLEIASHYGLRIELLVFMKIFKRHLLKRLAHINHTTQE